MPIEGFQYEDFAKNLAQQASEVVPADLDKNAKAYIVNLIFNYCVLAGEALDKDDTVQLNVQQACIICQFIGEWTFHKAIDIIRSNMPLEVRDETLQKVAFTVFEIAKLAMIKEIPMQQIITLVEQHVKKAFDETINDLNKRGLINEELAQNAVAQSNIDAMTQETPPPAEETPDAYTQEAPPSQNQSKRILKLASLALLFKNLPPEKIKSVLKKFNAKDADLIAQYIQMPDLQAKLDSTIALKCLKEIRNNLPKSQNINSEKINKKLKSIVKNSAQEKISIIIKNERENIKKVVDMTQNGEQIEFPPKIAAILCNYLEEKAKR